VTRHLLAASYDGGFERALVVTSPATHAAVSRAVAARAIPKLEVEVRQGDPPAAAADDLTVEAREVMTRADLGRRRGGQAPELQSLVVTDRTTAERGRRRLVAAITKSMHMDGIWCWLFMRPISRLL